MDINNIVQTVARVGIDLIAQGDKVKIEQNKSNCTVNEIAKHLIKC